MALGASVANQALLSALFGLWRKKFAGAAPARASPRAVTADAACVIARLEEEPALTSISTPADTPPTSPSGDRVTLSLAGVRIALSGVHAERIVRFVLGQRGSARCGSRPMFVPTSVASQSTCASRSTRLSASARNEARRCITSRQSSRSSSTCASSMRRRRMVNRLSVTASAQPSPLPRSNASAGLLANMLVNTYVAHLPLHRQEMRYARRGIGMASG
uniref:Uncharacterized protein pseudogene n=1 Tax=Candidatus Paraburkholderia kirkii UZHbot1 TaxID=1055526 RepID=G4MK70_9BURK